MSDSVNHPSHYGGADNPHEAIKCIDAHGLGFCLGNVVKYVLRADKKGAAIEDLEKAAWYLNHEIERRRSRSPQSSASAPQPPERHSPLLVRGAL